MFEPREDGKCKCGENHGHAGWLLCYTDELAAFVNETVHQQPTEPIKGGFIPSGRCPHCGHQMPDP